MKHESEAKTRKSRIDKKLVNLGWQILPYRLGLNTETFSNHAVGEYPTENGPADYALFVEGKLLGIIEAKKLSVGAQNAMEQAKRYAKGVVHSIGSWNGFMVPFLYSTNGELVFYLDVRSEQNLNRAIADFHTPQALKELYARNDENAYNWFLRNENKNPRLRPYQKDAIDAIEKNISEGKRKFMVAMATGTGKTYTTVDSVYRLLKSNYGKRILFLVDRKALAAQATTAFAAYETPQGNKFNQEYEVYSQRFRKEDFEEGERFDGSVLPNEYLTKPDATKTFVYVSTIQRMAINLLGKEAVFNSESNDVDAEDDADKLDIPIHAFDVIIADECHRGYTSHDSNTWRKVLDYFDAVKIGLTATPAAHTVAYFGNPVFRYTVEQGISDGYLVDYNAVNIKSDVRINGVFLEEGEQVGKIDTLTGQLRIEGLEDERQFDSSQVERDITAPDSNRKIVQEFAKHALQFERDFGRFPKSLFFCVNDIAHISHAESVVNICKEVFNRGDDFVMKITGNQNVDRPLEKIRRFRNRPEPKIVVSVDMLSTGVDIPALEFIVFLRPVKSRILWEQMLGRGTRLCSDLNKESFTIFDCFNGTLIEYFKNVSNFDMSFRTQEAVSISEIIRRIYNNEEREYNVKALRKRLRRIERTMSAEARNDFAAFIPDGDMGRFADELADNIENDFTNTMRLLNNKNFQELLVNYKRATTHFYVAEGVVDVVSSEALFKAGDKTLKPDEYLAAFETFVKENKTKIEAIKILLERPKNYNAEVLKQLHQFIQQNKFKENDLRKAHNIVYNKAMVDIISMIRHAAKETEPLLEIYERVDRAIQKVFGNRVLTQEQQKWIEYIRNYLHENLSLEADDFDNAPVFENKGGRKRFELLFSEKVSDVVQRINEALAA